MEMKLLHMSPSCSVRCSTPSPPSRLSPSSIARSAQPANPPRWKARCAEYLYLLYQWFPEAARAMVLQGAEILFYPTAIGSEPQDDGLYYRDN